MLNTFFSLTFRQVSLAVSIPVYAATSVAQSLPPSSSASLQVLYTGRLLGYFRAPDRQPGDRVLDCRSADDTGVTKWSKAAHEFHEIRNKSRDAILLGTGDNFAPEFEARILDPIPPPEKSCAKATPGKEQYGNKDQYSWYPGGPAGGAARWVRFDRKDRKDCKDQDVKSLEADLRTGRGKIEMDNVGCFLLRERYSAVVPGKHDFYFGAERLRQLAQFLEDKSVNKTDKSVKMLGANLVIQTTWKDDHRPLPDTEHNLNFVPKWP